MVMESRGTWATFTLRCAPPAPPPWSLGERRGASSTRVLLTFALTLAPVERKGSAARGTIQPVLFDEPEAPPWMLHLSRDARGFLVPAEAPWNADGSAALAEMDVDRALILGFHRACAVCGYSLNRERPVFRAFSQGDAARIRLEQSDMAPEFSGPVHRSCILFSMIVCPYMREPTARLGKQSKIKPGGRRGTRAAVMGFDDYVVMMADAATDEPPIQFGFVKLVEDRPYKHGIELLPDLDLAVQDDSKRIDVANTRPLYWPGGGRPESAIRGEARRLAQRVRPIDTPFAGATIDGVDYNCYELPQRYL